MNYSIEKLNELFTDFGRLKALIVGDVMVDAYLWGKVDRISPEAPVPVVLVNKKSNMLGGAANVALNIRTLGATPILCSVVGNDSMGKEFIRLLEKDNISAAGIIESESRITTTKFRIIGNKFQLLRVDEEVDTDLSMSEEEMLLLRIRTLMEQNAVDVVILQDYNKGILTPTIIEQVIHISKKQGIPVVVDPKKKNFNCYRDIDLFKPNLKELKEGLQLEPDISSIESISSACAQWQDQQNITAIMVTLSESGIFIREKIDGTAEYWHLPAHVRTISDVSGAGDTVISVASLCRALRADAHLTTALANIAGGLVCEYVGVVPVKSDQLLAEAIKLLK